MKVGDLVVFRYNPYIGVVLGFCETQGCYRVYWFDDSKTTYENENRIGEIK